MKPSIISPKLAPLFGILSVILGWQLVATLIHAPLLLPSPGTTLAELRALAGTGDFWHHLGVTLVRGVAGFGIAFLTGLTVGIVAGRFRAAGEFLRPIIVFIRSTPVMSVIILALIWFRRETVPIFVIFLMAFPIVVQNVMEGIRGIDPELREMVKVFRVGKYRSFTRLYLPALAPFLAAGVSAGLGLTWKVLIAAEVLSYPKWGIGSQMDTARVFLQTEKVFAWTLVVIALGLIFDYLLEFLLKLPFAKWRRSAHD